jgi:hypothetical protein
MLKEGVAEINSENSICCVAFLLLLASSKRQSY